MTNGYEMLRNNTFSSSSIICCFHSTLGERPKEQMQLGARDRANHFREDCLGRLTLGSC